MHDESTDETNTAPPGARLQSWFVRERGALLITGDFAAVTRDLDLHALACGIEYEPLVRTLLVDGLTALGFHLATRPADESVGWTVTLPGESLNLFFTGHAGDGTVVGRAFTEGVEPRDESLFFAQVKRGRQEARTSTVPVNGLDLYDAVEHFWEQSEQKVARFFHDTGTSAFLTSLPEGDDDWIRAVDVEEVFALSGSDGVRFLAERPVVFRCGCDKAVVTRVLVAAYGDAVDDLFARDESVRVECPRCGAGYTVARGEYDEARRSPKSDD